MILQSDTASRKNKGVNDQFLSDVLDGLSQSPKRLQSKYFYDTLGDGFFQQIMALPEYYLTRCELDIFQNKTKELASVIMADESPFDLIELGAGDATKSSYLLKYLKTQEADFTYMPIDISGNILSVLEDRLGVDVPGLDIVSLQGDYFDMLGRAATLSSRRKAVLFLGSNIGNMEMEEAYGFCRELRKNLNKGDIVLMGFDLKKHPQTILDAYSDKAGVTAAFNLNLLTRINRELEANFELRQFEHYQNYDPLTGACRSYLVSLREQDVAVGSTTIHFEKSETIYMEVSQKFSLTDTEQLALAGNFSSIGTITDKKGWFTDAFWLAV